jgi:uncharacterized protein YjiS (DUF1127 family)
MPFSSFFNRRSRLQAYRQAKRDLELITDHDLADMGIKRYQLEAHLPS